MYCLFFFFSSRRRHTRLQGDWSSDVCSSDLLCVTGAVGAMLLATARVALAEVVTVGHTTFTNVVTNPCDPADGPIALTTDSYFVFKVQPDGSLQNHIVF